MLEANKDLTYKIKALPICSTALEGKMDTCPQTMPVRRGGLCSTGLRLMSGKGMEPRYPIDTAG